MFPPREFRILNTWIRDINYKILLFLISVKNFEIHVYIDYEKPQWTAEVNNTKMYVHVIYNFQ